MRAAGTSASRVWICAIPATPPAAATGWWAMAPGACMPLEAATRRALLQAARESIQRRLTGNRHDPVATVPDAALAEPRATFVTLMRQHALRGCIGTLEVQRPLLQDVIHNAQAAA